MLPAEVRDDAAARRSVQEAELEQVRLVDVLDRLRLLAERDRERRQADGTAAELVDEGAQQLTIESLQPGLVVSTARMRAERRTIAASSSGE